MDKITVGRLERIFKLTQAKARQGRATSGDSLLAEIKMGEAQLRLTRTLEQLKSVRADLAELLAFPPDTQFVVTPYPVPMISVTGLESAVAVVLSNRLDYAQA